MKTAQPQAHFHLANMRAEASKAKRHLAGEDNQQTLTEIVLALEILLNLTAPADKPAQPRHD